MAIKNNKEKDEILSNRLKFFLDLVTNSERDYNFSHDLMSHHDKEISDILHEIELSTLNYSKRAKLATKLRDVRQNRRREKNTTLLLKPIVEFFNTKEGKICINKLQQILGETRKTEKYIQDKVYRQRTDILKNI